jgi:predicted DNA-binding transcriptional regulator AlpA
LGVFILNTLLGSSQGKQPREIMPPRTKSKQAAAARHAAAVQRMPMPQFTPIAEPNPKRLIFKKEVLRRVPLSYASVWKMMCAGTFPRAVACGSKNAWHEDEVEKFIANLPRRTFKGDPT